METYNHRVDLLIEEIVKELPSYLIVDQGRNKFEKSCILVDKGIFCGMGYVREHNVPKNLELAKAVLTPYPSYLFIEKLLSDFVLNNPHKQILVN